MIAARRLYSTAMGNGDVGLGVLFGHRLDTIRLRPRNGLPLAQQILIVLEGISPDEVVVSFPGPHKAFDREATAAAYNVAMMLRRPTTRFATAEDVQDLEHEFGCNRHLYKRCGHYTIETVHRLHSAYRCAQRNDRPFGKAMPFSDHALFARLTFVAEENASLRREVCTYEIALAECEAAGVEHLQ